MKRWMVGILALSVCLSLAGCTNQPHQETLTSRDVLAGYDKITNLNVFEDFVTHVEQGTKDRIRIFATTDEGDPIIRELDFDGKTIRYAYDDSQDRFGGPDRGKKSAACGRIDAQKTTSGTDYALEDCTPEKSDAISYFLLRVPRPM